MDISFDDASSIGSSNIVSSSMSGSVSDFREIVDLLSDDDDEALMTSTPARINAIPATNNSAFLINRRPPYRINEVIDLMSDDEDDNQHPHPNALFSPNASAAAVEAPVVNNGRILNENSPLDHVLQAAESLLNVTNNLRVMSSDLSMEQPLIKKQKLSPSVDTYKTNTVKIKTEFEAVGFGEANVGDEIIEIENPLSKKSSNSSDLLQNEIKLKVLPVGTTTNHNSSNSIENDEDDDAIEYVGGNTNVASEMPHPRESCLKFRFSTTDVIVSLKVCSQCYCFVCEIKSSECKEWPRHCLATHKLNFWKQEKQIRQCKLIQLLPREASADFFLNYRHLLDGSIVDHNQNSISNQISRSFQDNRSTSHSDRLIMAAKSKIDSLTSTKTDISVSDIIQIAILLLYGIRAKATSAMFNVSINNMYETMLHIILHPTCPQTIKNLIKVESSNLKLPVLVHLCDILLYISSYINNTTPTTTTNPTPIRMDILLKMLNLPEAQIYQIINYLINKQIFSFLIDFIKYSKNINIRINILWNLLKSIEDEKTNQLLQPECNLILTLIYENGPMDWNRLAKLIVTDINIITINKCLYLLDFFHIYFQSFQIQQLIGKRLLILLTSDFQKFSNLQLEDKTNEELYHYIRTYTLLINSNISYVMQLINDTVVVIDPLALLFICLSFVLRIPIFDYYNFNNYNIPLLPISANTLPATNTIISCGGGSCITSHTNGNSTTIKSNEKNPGFPITSTTTYNNFAPLAVLPVLPVSAYLQSTNNTIPTPTPTPTATPISSFTSTPPTNKTAIISAATINISTIADIFINCHDTITLLFCRILCYKINHREPNTTITSTTLENESRYYLLKLSCEIASTYFRKVSSVVGSTVDKLHALKIPKDVLIGWSVLANDKNENFKNIPNSTSTSTIPSPYDVLQLSNLLPLDIAVKISIAICRSYSATSKITSSKERILYSFTIPLRIIWKSFLQFIKNINQTTTTSNNVTLLNSFCDSVLNIFETIEIHEMSSAITFLKRECSENWIEFLILYYLKDIATTELDIKNTKIFLFFRKVLVMIQKNIIPIIQIDKNNNNNNNAQVCAFFSFWYNAFSAIASMLLGGKFSAVYFLFHDWCKINDYFKRTDKALFLNELKNLHIEDINDSLLLNNICQFLTTICKIEYIPLTYVTAFIELVDTPSTIFNMLLMSSKQKILKDIALLTFSPKVIEKIKSYYHTPNQPTLIITNTGTVQLGPPMKKNQCQKCWNEIKKDVTAALRTVNENNNNSNGHKPTKTPVRTHGKYATSSDMILTACYLEDSELIEKVYLTTFKNKYPTGDLTKDSDETVLILKLFNSIDNTNILSKLIYLFRDWLAEIALLQVESYTASLLTPIINKFQISLATSQNIPESLLLLFYYHPTSTSLQLLFATLNNSISLSMIHNNEMKQKLLLWIQRANKKELFRVEDYLEIICFHLQPDKPLLLLRSCYSSKSILTATVITRCFLIIQKEKNLAKDLFNWMLSLLLQIDAGVTIAQDCRDAIKLGMASVSRILDTNPTTTTSSYFNNKLASDYLFSLELCTLFLKLISTPTLSLFVEVQRYVEVEPWREFLVYLILDDRNPHACIDILIHEKDYQRLFSMLMNTSSSIEKTLPLLDGLTEILTRTRGSFLLSSVVLPLRGLQLSSNSDSINAMSAFMELTQRDSFIRRSVPWVVLLYSLLTDIPTTETTTISTNIITNNTANTNAITIMQIKSNITNNNQNAITNINNNNTYNNINTINTIISHNSNNYYNNQNTSATNNTTDDKKHLLKSKLESFIKTLCHWSHNSSFLKVYFECCSLTNFSNEKLQALSRNTKLMKMTCQAQQIHLSGEFLDADDFLLGDEICQVIVNVEIPVLQKIGIFKELLLSFKGREMNPVLSDMLNSLTVTCLSKCTTTTITATPQISNVTEAPSMWFCTPTNKTCRQPASAVLSLLEVVVDQGGGLAAIALEAPLLEALAESPLQYSLLRPEWVKFLSEVAKVQPCMAYVSYLIRVTGEVLDVTEFIMMAKEAHVRGTQRTWIRVVGEILQYRLSHGTLTLTDIVQSIRMIVHQLQASLVVQPTPQYPFNPAFVTSHLCVLMENHRMTITNEFSKLAARSSETVGKIFVEHPALLIAVTTAKTTEIFENSKTLSSIWKAILRTENPEAINALQKSVDSVVELIDNSRVTTVLKNQFAEFFNDLKQAMQGSNIGIAKWSVIIQCVRRRLSRKKAVLQAIAHL